MTPQLRTATLARLRKARALVARPYGWCKRQSRRHTTRTDDGWAYCAVGALIVSGNDTELPSYDAARRALTHCAAGYSVAQFNDSHSKADVVALFDRAIALVERGA